MSADDDSRSTEELVAEALGMAVDDSDDGDDVFSQLLDRGQDDDEGGAGNLIPDDVMDRARDDIVAFAEELTTIDGRPADYSGAYRYLREPLREAVNPDAPRLQMWVMNRGGGKSETAVRPLGYVAATKALRDTMYAVPRSDQLSDFMNLKLGRMFRQSRGAPDAPILMDMLDGHGVAVKRNQFQPYPDGSGSVITGRSAWNDGRAIQGFHGDFGVFDEIQNWTATAIENGKEAIDGGMARVLMLGTPDYEGTPYHAHFERSDQRNWFVDCPDCSTSQTISLDNVRLVDRDPKSWERVCISCEATLSKDYILETGRWEATNPGAPYRSYRWTQLTSPRHDLDEVMRAKESPNVPEQEFQNFKLARFFSGGAKPIPKAAIYAVAEPELSMRRQAIGDVTYYAGVDWGGGENADCFVVVGHVLERDSSGYPVDVAIDLAERIDFDRRPDDLRQVAEILSNFKIDERGRAVADQGFGTSHVASLQDGDERFDTIPKFGFGSSVMGHQFGSVSQDQRRWDYLKQERWTIHAYQPPWANRFIELFPSVDGYDDVDHADQVDYDLSRTRDRGITIPYAEDSFTQDRVEYWTEHLTSVKRDFRESEKSGKKREYFTTFSSGQKDDGFYAGVYMLTAMVLGPTSNSSGASVGGRAG